ncbi:MAG: PDZ domain-containing protein, partial [Bacteroidaceae bacterium]|nr:PDZ domain-containing protein [Bacteroidaceae bacterium]
MKFLKSVLILALLTTSSVGAKADEHTFEVAKNLDIFHSLFTQLEMFYVDSIDVKRSMLIGIDAILEDLDPYTEYYSEEDMGDLKLMTTGKYGGIGSLIRMRKDSTVMIAEPYEGMPAAEVGLKVGDILLQIDTIDLKGKTTSEVSELLRGEPGTT